MSDDDATDSTFAGNLTNKVTELGNQARDACLESCALMHSPWGFVPMTDKSRDWPFRDPEDTLLSGAPFQPPVDRWQTLFGQFTTASLDVARATIINLHAQYGPEKLLEHHVGRPPVWDQIRLRLADWKGFPGSAADNFRIVHVGQLEGALKGQHEVAQALPLIARAHAAVIEFGRQEALDTASRTIEALKGVQDAAERREHKLLEQLGADLAKIGGGAAVGGPLGAVAVALEVVVTSVLVRQPHLFVA